MRDFNSIKVRLEPTNSASALSYRLFQFHKGTIRTVLQVPVFSSIRYFNSIKVRLEPYLPVTLPKILLYFNSIKVRLELFTKVVPPLLTLFQFHKGTIRTGDVPKYRHNFPYFNSIKVRLELLPTF